MLGNKVIAQNCIIHSNSPSEICSGGYTSVGVTITSGTSPYTVVYSDGINQYTENGYTSEKVITVQPATTSTYSLISVTDYSDNSLEISPETAIITVDPLPSNIIVSPSSPVCPGSNFTISATATHGSSFELWNQAKTTQIGVLPFTTSISSPTQYTVVAISEKSCSADQAYTVTLDNVNPTIENCPSDQNIAMDAGNCTVSLPDFRSYVTVSDNCTASGSITLNQNPSPATVLSGNGTTQLITITATDASNNSALCSFTLTLKDTEKPAISGTAPSGNRNTDAGA
ncbi:MAG: hypothetical protein Q8905_07720, partial [Bacteroidota bacterium]|nr:hypothetical protein [Bacteroidota bacterium]